MAGQQGLLERINARLKETLKTGKQDEETPNGRREQRIVNHMLRRHGDANRRTGGKQHGNVAMKGNSDKNMSKATAFLEDKKVRSFARALQGNLARRKVH